MSPPQASSSASPDSIVDVLRKALALDKAGRHADAKALCMSRMATDGQNPQLLHLLGVIEHHSGDFENAEKHISRAVALKGDMADAWRNLAHVQKDTGNWPSALQSLDAALRLQPQNAMFMAAIGQCHESLGEFNEAEAWYRRALTVDPALTVARTALGTLLMRIGKLAEADTQLDKALAGDPASVKALTNLAILRGMQGREDEIIPIYDRILKHNPDHAETHATRARELLKQERFAEGWAALEWRLRCADHKNQRGVYMQPQWKGEPLAGKKILVWTEQGPGDEILYATMIPDLLKRGARCILACSPRMAPVFARSFPDVVVADYTAAAQTHGRDGSINFQASISDLGRHLRLSLQDFPRAAILAADGDRAARLRERHQAATPRLPLVGISWHSANATASDYKSIPLHLWKNILQTPGITWVSLQYGDPAAGLRLAKEKFGVDVRRDADIDPLRDLDGFAAQVAAMDLVITASNTTAHVAGALGKPVWVMTPASYGSPWYWFREHADSPWYPAMTLFRQRIGESWSGALSAVAAKLSGGVPA